MTPHHCKCGKPEAGVRGAAPDGPFDRAQGPSRAASRDGKFSKTEHILKSRDFRNIYKKGLRARFDAVILHYLPNELEHSRLGFSIGSRFVKQASKRNRIRRVFREVYRRKKKGLKKNFDLVLVIKSDFGGRISYKKLESVFLKLAGSARLI